LREKELPSPRKEERFRFLKVGKKEEKASLGKNVAKKRRKKLVRTNWVRAKKKKRPPSRKNLPYIWGGEPRGGIGS